MQEIDKPEDDIVPHEEGAEENSAPETVAETEEVKQEAPETALPSAHEVHEKYETQKIFAATEQDNRTPVYDFLILASLIVTGPFILLYKLFRGRIKSPVVIVFILCVGIYALYELSISGSAKNKGMSIARASLDEITPEEKEEMRNEISTLRKSIGEDKIPQPLAPLLDVPIDMLNINYFAFMIQSGYIAPNGAGSEFILGSYLRANHKLLREKSWEALHNINTDAAKKVIADYEAAVQAQKEEIARKKAAQQPIRSYSTFDDIKDSINSKFMKLKGNPF